MIPVSAPPRVREHLRGAADGTVEVVHRGPDAVYVDVAAWCVGVVGRRATAVPCALRSTLDRLGAASRAHVQDGVLHLDGEPLRIGRIVDVRVPAAPHLADRLRPALTPADVAAMIGLGDGLTPLGDDVVCGWLALHRAAGVATPEIDAAVRDLALRTTLLSATLLECALHGEVLPEFAAYVSALGTHAEPERAADLEAVGHSSGAGLLHGARLALGAVDQLMPAA
jgi:Protein of unknown function (DUF2877)